MNREDAKEKKRREEFASSTGKVRIAHPTNTGSGDIRNVWRSIYLHRKLKLNT